jgi:hypothetical protein
VDINYIKEREALVEFVEKYSKQDQLRWSLGTITQPYWDFINQRILDIERRWVTWDDRNVEITFFDLEKLQRL